jgi:microcystin-dependent protein
MAGTQTVCVTSPLVISDITVVDPVLGPVQVPVATASCHLAPAAVAAGTYAIAAEYPGQPGSFVGSTSTPAALVVQSAPTQTSVTVSSSSASYGRESKETLTAKVSEPSAGSSFVSGSVTLRNAARILCVTTLDQGVATCRLSQSQLPIGRHSIIADYAGTTSLDPSASQPVTVNVTKAPTTSALSVSRTSAAYGSERSVRFTARVTVPSGLPAASGRVFVMSGATKLCVIDLVRGKGSCSIGASELAVGRHLIVARYEGSTDLQVSVSHGETVTVTSAPKHHK